MTQDSFLNIDSIQEVIYYTNMNSYEISGISIELYIAAGVASSLNFMEMFRLTLHQKLENVCEEVHSELLFPYGDWSRSVVKQLQEISHDMRYGAKSYRKSVGGARMLNAVDGRHSERQKSQNSQLILIGHSAGGVAAVHTAMQMIEREATLCGQSCPIVMIGSPRCPIPPSLRNSVLYLYAAQGTQDPINRIGTFGGWRLSKYRLPFWHSHKYAPAASVGLPIIGGHADYFRHLGPYVNEDGQSNLQITTEAVYTWLVSQLSIRN